MEYHEQGVCPECGCTEIERGPAESQENFDNPFSTVVCVCMECACEFTEEYHGAEYAGITRINPC